MLFLVKLLSILCVFFTVMLSRCNMAAVHISVHKVQVTPVPLGQISLFWFCLDQSYCKKPYRQNCLWPALKKRKISHRQGTKVSSERRLFSKMNFVTWRSSCHSSYYRILNRILKWQELRRVASVYWESLCGCNLHTPQIRTPRNLHMKRRQIL